MCNCIENIESKLIGQKVIIKRKEHTITDACLDDFGLVGVHMICATYSNVTVFYGEKRHVITIPHSYCPFCGTINKYGEHMNKKIVFG